MKEDDKNDYFKLYNEQSLFQYYMNYFEFNTFRDWEWEETQKNDILWLTIKKRDTNEFIGSIDLRGLDGTTPEISIEILKSFQNQGIASNIVPLLAKRSSILVYKYYG